MPNIDYIQLGGTLFIPASHLSLTSVVLEQKYPHLRSLVIDTEDGLDASELASAMKKIEMLLPEIKKPKLLIFLRPRNPHILSLFLQMPGIKNIAGFVLPKFSLTNASDYLELMDKTEHAFMPSIEGEELFDTQKLIALKELLLNYKERIVLVRFGLEDMSHLLLIRRSCDESIFDISAPNAALGNFVGIFKSAGFGVSGGVYGCYEDDAGFIKDLKRDLREGLFSKTIIHPKQIALTEECYRVSQEELKDANAIIESQKSLIGMHGKMLEKQTMYKYALFIQKRAKFYGVQ